MPLSQLLCFRVRDHGSSIDTIHLHDPESQRSQQPVEPMHRANHCKRDAFVLIVISYKLTENTTKIVHHACPTQYHTNKMQNPSQQVIGYHEAEATHHNGERGSYEGLPELQKRSHNPNSRAKHSS